MTAAVTERQPQTPARRITREFTREKRRAALHSVIAATVMTALKFAAGLFSGSLGMLSEAAHSALDLAGSALTFFSVSISDKPADEDHTYGHGKLENLSAFAETGLMAISCAWIIWEAMSRITSHQAGPLNSLWPMLVLALSGIVDYWRSRRLAAVARRTESSALAADAFHFASDIWSTIAVFIGLAASWLGSHYKIGWLSYADPFAAMMVSMLILRQTWHLAREATSVLLDAAPIEIRQQMLREVGRVPGVLSIEQARIRRAGSDYFADLTLALPRTHTFEHTNQLVREATEAVRRVAPRADVVIHTIPRATSAESIFDRVRAVAARNNVAVHEVSVQSIHGKLRVELHAELNETLSLRQAHDFVTSLEAEILRESPEVDSVLTHIESEPATIEQPEEFLSKDLDLEQALRASAQKFPEVLDVHDILIGRTGEHLRISCHCTLADNLPIRRVHEIITALEDRFKADYPAVESLLIHPEPETDNSR